jgi:hypothetical protein
MPKITTSREQADNLVQEFLQSKQTQKEFCRERNLNVGTFQWWLRRYKECIAAEKKIETKTPFVRVTPKTSVTTAGLNKESELTIDFQNGTRMKWRGIEIPTSLHQLITTLTTTGDVL